MAVWLQMRMLWSPVSRPPLELTSKGSQRTSRILVQTLRRLVIARFLRVTTLSVFRAALHRRMTCPTGMRFADEQCNLIPIVTADASCRSGSVTLKECFILNSGVILWNSSFWIQSKKCMSVVGARTCWHARATRSDFFQHAKTTLLDSLISVNCFSKVCRMLSGGSLTTTSR